MQAVTLGAGALARPQPSSPKVPAQQADSRTVLSSTTDLLEKLKLKLEVGKDGEVELDLRARLRSVTRTELDVAGSDGAVRAVARLSESISLRIHVEIDADKTAGGLKDALQQLASGFKDALDSLAASFADSASGSGAKLVSKVRDAFASLLDGLKPAFESSAGAALAPPDPAESPETHTRERERSREEDEGRTRTRDSAREVRPREDSRPLDPRFVRLRSDLQNRFAQGLNILLQTLEGRTPNSTDATPAAGAPASDAGARSEPTSAPTPARSAFEIQLYQRQEVRFRLIELRV